MRGWPAVLVTLLSLVGCRGTGDPPPARPYDPAGLTLHRRPVDRGRPCPILLALPDGALRIAIDNRNTVYRFDAALDPPRLVPAPAPPGSLVAPTRSAPARWQEASRRLRPPCLHARRAGRLQADPHPRESLHAEVEVRRPGAGPWEPGLYLRGQPDGSRLEARVRVARDALGTLRYRLGLRVVAPGRRAPLHDALGPPVDGEWHQLALLLAGARVHLFWDRRLLHTCNTAFVAPGTAGLANGAGHTLFRRFRLSAPPGTGRPLRPAHRADPLLAAGTVCGGEWRRAPEPLPRLDTIHFTPTRGTSGPWGAWVDWEGDGDLDLVLSRATFPLALVENRGAPGFTPPRTIRGRDGRPLPTTLRGVIPCAADLDGDGRPDLLLGCPDGTLRWYPGQWLGSGPAM